MGVCLSVDLTAPKCIICDIEINNVKYLHCEHCHNSVHIKCLYSKSDTMNTCYYCNAEEIDLIDSNKHTKQHWSSQKQSTIRHSV